MTVSSKAHCLFEMMTSSLSLPGSATSRWLLLLVTGIFSGVSGCTEDTRDVGSPENAGPATVSDSFEDSATNQIAVEQQVKVFCGACHAVPLPDSFPKDAWYHEVKRGFDFYYASGRKDLTPPPQALVVGWYRQRAPERLASPEQTEAGTSPLKFERRFINIPMELSDLPAVSVLRRNDSAVNPSRVWVSDMRLGCVVDCDVNDPENARFLRIGTNPAGTRSADLDQDGSMDLIVADLGTFLPEDHQKGQVLWLSDAESKTTASTPRVILDGIGRVADVQSADFDNDGDQDLAVAEFGWHKTGGIHVVFNDVNAAGEHSFRSLKIDSRPGTIHLPVTDLDGDGRLDFVALISQEHEVIEAFMNRETGFEKVSIYAAPDPSYGSSGIDLCDFDGDGDIDVLYTVGDTFDSHLIKPYHGIWLLRNMGQLKFEPERIAAMPGVLRALSADLDGDGDQDIVAAALLPLKSIQGTAPEGLQALIWLEQKTADLFERHVIQKGPPIYSSILLSDTDADGDIDITAGCFYAEPADPPALLHLFENVGQK
jgi:hypothetical protein